MSTEEDEGLYQEISYYYVLIGPPPIKDGSKTRRLTQRMKDRAIPGVMVLPAMHSCDESPMNITKSTLRALISSLRTKNIMAMNTQTTD